MDAAEVQAFIRRNLVSKKQSYHAATALAYVVHKTVATVRSKNPHYNWQWMQQ
jgi:hypothetical protein